MKNKQIYLVAIVALIIGFAIAWMVKPGNLRKDESSEHSIENTDETIWTCSMHPQIRQNEPGQCPICAMDLIPLTETSSADPTHFEMTEEAVQLANIQTTIIGSAKASAESQMKLNGTIKADETRASSLVAHVPGRIEKLFVSYTGETVRQGQKIASIYSPDLITAQKELLELSKIKDISTSLQNAARNKLKYWKISDAQIDAILNSGQVQETFSILADRSGIVASKKINVGDYVKTGQVLFDVQSLNKLWVLFDAYESQISMIKKGDQIKFSTTSLSGTTFDAKVTFIDPVIDPKTRVAKIRAEVNNSSGNLKPEMFVKGIITGAAAASESLSVPKSAVLWTGERSVVYVKVPNTNTPTFEYKEITLGASEGKSYQVSSGLEAGDEVVTNGAFVIDASAQLNNQKSMMNKTTSIKQSGHDHSGMNMQGTAESFTVYGNCELCEETIEGALQNVKGIYKGDWNMDSKILTVNYDEGVISIDQIKQRIADAGYDTDTHRASDAAYSRLAKCCQFERPAP